MEQFPEFSMFPYALKIKILNLRFFDLKIIVQELETFYEPFTPYQTKRRSFGKPTKVFTWAGMNHALSLLARWAGVFARGQVGMILAHLNKLEAYYHTGYKLRKLVKYSDAIRFRSTGV